ncbi:MAG: hypothetical protein AB7G28_04490 [Pirellulales bacterium]
MNHFCRRRIWSIATLAILTCAAAAFGEDAAKPAESTPPDAGSELSVDQARLADRYERLEIVVARLAELSASSDPRRAKVLREALAKSREEGMDERFETIVGLLEGERLSVATGRQAELQKELDTLLALLLKADRDRELDSQTKRVKAYLKEVGRLIRLQKGVHARTEGGDDAKRLAEDQKQVGDQTGDLGKAISDTEKTDGKSGKSSNGKESKGDSSDGKSSPKESLPIELSPKEKSDDAGKGESPESGKSQGKPSQSPSRSEGQPSPGQPSEGQPSEGQQGKQGKSGQQGQQGQQGQSGQSGESSEQDEQSQEPTDRAAEKLKQAQQAMQEAQKKLEEAERKGAAQAQQQALKELEQAKAELERVLRQLREEEMERTLTMLAARFRKMLEAQTKVYEATQRVARVPLADRDHDEEIEAARLSREESLIAREADRALLLLREEGSSLAFPETVSLMHEDMLQVAELLGEMKVGKLTQGLEEDIIEALEEMIAALDKAIKDLEKKKTPQGKPQQAGQPGDPPLVDKLAELKMIRSLQMRINRRTLRYGEAIEDEPAEAPKLRDEMLELAQRQQRVYQATHDLSQGRND